jgi:hypothetical protein
LVGGVALAASVLTACVVRDPRHTSMTTMRRRGRRSSGEGKGESRGGADRSRMLRRTAQPAATGKAALATEATANHNHHGSSADANEEDKEEEPLMSVVASLLKPTPVRLLFAASAFRFCAGFSIGVWLPPLFRQVIFPIFLTPQPGLDVLRA